MTGRGEELLRRPGDPQQVTFLELFFDLAFVAALFQLSHALVQNLRWSGAFQAVVLLLALWSIWFGNALITDRLDPHRWVVQVVVLGSLVGCVVLAAVVPEAFGARGAVFAGAYVTIQVGRSVFFALALLGTSVRRDPARPMAWAILSAGPWIAGALVHGTARGVLWLVAIGLDYTGFTVRYAIPGLGGISESPVLAEHLAERYRQFFIIALGELILVTALGLSGSSLGAGRWVAFALSIATTVLLWRIYIHRAGGLLSAAIGAARHPVRLVESTTYTHLVMVAGIGFTAVGADLVIAHPLGHPSPAWLATVLGGPALFLAGRAGFEYSVFGRVSWTRTIGLLLLVALPYALLHVPLLVSALVATAVLTGIAVVDAVRTRGRPPEEPAPPVPG